MSNPSVRERIMTTAFNLFYRQGYRATGINQIIAESGVAKASFYDHFPSKESLHHAYLKELAVKELTDMRNEVERHSTPRTRFFAILGILNPWFQATEFRGCPFQNAVGEVPCDDDPEVLAAARLHRENLRSLLADLTAALVTSEPKLRNLDQSALVETYMTLLEGAIVLAVTYRQDWPIKAAERSLLLHLKHP